VRNRSRDDWFVLGMATAYAAAILAALCLVATQTPALSLVRVDVPEHGVNGAETCSEDIHGDTYVKLEEGLFAIPETELHRIEYVHCAELLNRNCARYASRTAPSAFSGQLSAMVLADGWRLKAES